MKELIKERRKQLDITLEEIGEYVGVSKTTVQRWESGNISNMRRDRIKKLAEILQVDVQQLVDGEREQSDFVRIPVLGQVAAGVPITAQEDITGYEDVPREWVKNDTLFALRIKGDSMEPRIVEGDVVVVRQQSDVENGQLAVVMVGEEATCKKVIKHTDSIALIANNPKYPPMLFSAQEIQSVPVTIIGRVVELRAKFE
ncbi:MAG: helix-turn-helix domain-containing protein [Oscillospiraceae bacterium]|nr:helix-turn-helix domain-containing protein [Oscillospiraceae bacterium]